MSDEELLINSALSMGLEVSTSFKSGKTGRVYIVGPGKKVCRRFNPLDDSDDALRLLAKASGVTPAQLRRRIVTDAATRTGAVA
jgi:hypothetical protein